MKTAITARALYTPLEDISEPLLVVEDDRIAQVSSRRHAEIPAGARLVDYADAVLVPGFVDIHIHGGAGCDLMSADAADLERFERSLLAHGVTSYFPTTVSAPLDRTFIALERFAAAIETGNFPALAKSGLERGTRNLRAQPLGIHLEGPFISRAKCGVHPLQCLLEPSLETFERLWQAARGQVSFITLAPELPKAEYLIAEAARRGVCVSLGHSDSTFEVAVSAIGVGARHATHTFNAMRALHQREPGIAGAVFTDARLTADIIADGIHVHPAMVALFLRALGPERAVLISDAISATEMPDGRYRLGDIEIEVRGLRCESHGTLAGSVLTLDCAVRNVMKFAGWNLRQAVRLATLNPARAAGVAGRKGQLAAGADADIVVLSARGEVMRTIVAGQGI